MTNTSFREHRELGDVRWHRDFDAALAMATEKALPVLLLFQEIPGCSTCVNFGHDVLANPLLVDAIEEHFVPVAIHNNKPGRDAEILARFREPSWNNPVIHFLHPDGKPIVPKLSNRYDPLGLHGKIVGTLEALGLPVPEYVKLLRRDLQVDYGLSETATFETPCFWSGETSLAQHPAVLTTEAGWIGSEEVVRVDYDPGLTSLKELSAFAATEGFTLTTNAGFRVDEAPQYYLSKSRFSHLPLSRAQRTRMNLAVPYNDRPESLLSPRQTRWLALPSLPSLSGAAAYRGDFMAAWRRLMATA